MKPISNAMVCLTLFSKELPPDFWEEPTCKSADAKGAYAWTELFAATYVVAASAPGFRFDNGDPKDGLGTLGFPLEPGEHKKNVDVILHAGGVEITGVVNDIGGGPIARARVSARMGAFGNDGTSPAAETDDKGAFSLWVPEGGNVSVIASADGYAKGSQEGRAPGTFEIVLTPESSLSGVVIDARNGQPIEGADVSIDVLGRAQTRTDAKGAFRIRGLVSGRYTAIVRGEKGYGESEGSTLVGLGEHVTGVVVRVFPAARVIGKVIVGATKEVCRNGGILLNDVTRDRSVSRVLHRADDDGTITISGLLPGTYSVGAWCPRMIGRDDYPPIVVTDKDIAGLVWEVDAGAILVGRVTSRCGTPVADATVDAHMTTERSDSQSARTNVDGTYEMNRMRTGTYRLVVTATAGAPDRNGYVVETKAGFTVRKDIVLDDSGTLTGTVVDEEGKAVPDVSIDAMPIDNILGSVEVPSRTDASGTFTIRGLGAGDYRVITNLRGPGTPQSDTATIEAGKTSTVKIVVESQSGTIKGVVLDAGGAPVSDAFIASARESDATGIHSTRPEIWNDVKPVLAGVDGRFVLTKLEPGRYTLRAYRKGGGEAVLEHVEVGTTMAKLQIKPTGSIAGTVKVRGSLPDEIHVAVEDPKTGFRRGETFFRTDGHFVMPDLPAGRFQVSATIATGHARIEVDLASGEAKTGVTLTLDQLVTLTGRVVDHVTRAPIAGIQVFAQIAKGGSLELQQSADPKKTSDASGRFTVTQVPRGKLAIQCLPIDFSGSDYSWFRTMRDVTATTASSLDIGDVPLIKRRVKVGHPVGVMGLGFKQQPPETRPEDEELRVSVIDPNGPAANTAINVGSVVVSVDGVDVRGIHAMNAWTLVQAPPGTKLVLGLADGRSITIKLAAP
ncbi:MAG: carboxypeptidase regulatory-like domain-containing protein [Kofleriaceae bacterium]